MVGAEVHALLTPREVGKVEVLPQGGLRLRARQIGLAIAVGVTRQQVLPGLMERDWTLIGQQDDPLASDDLAAGVQLERIRVVPSKVLVAGGLQVASPAGLGLLRVGD